VGPLFLTILLRDAQTICRAKKSPPTVVRLARTAAFFRGDSDPYRASTNQGVQALSMHSDEAHRRAEALFRKAQHVRKGEQGMAEYQAKLDAMREKTARLRALRLARDATTKNTLPATSRPLQPI
jgi:hypothetical protein